MLKPDGTITAASVADNDATGHLIKNGQNYPNYAFTLAQSKLLKLPKMDSGRIFVSLGEPLYIKILDDANGNVGFAGPNPLNGTDPNIGIRFDWYEFTYNDAGLWINTTQVDEFGVPLLFDVWGDSKKFHMQTGLQETHDALYAAYAKEVPAEFQAALQNPLRIMAPGKSTFNVGQPNEHCFDDYVNQMWSFYSSNTLTVELGGSRRFVGKVQAGNLVLTEVDLGNGAFVGGTYTVGKPTTQDILEGKGTLAQGNSVELALEAQICAAFNRHIMEDASLWAAPSAWYLASPANYYAKFWHTHGVGGLAYGFACDDVSDQSSTIISVTPEHMILTIGW